MGSIKAFLSDESGQGTTEYAIIVVLIAVALIGTLVLFRQSIIDKFNEITQSIKGAR